MKYTEQIIWNVFQDEMNQLVYPTEEMGGEEGCCLIVLCFLFSFWSWRFEMRFTTENDMIPLIPGLGCIIIPYNPVKWVLQPECQTTASRPQFTGATSIFNFFFRFLSSFLFLLLFLSFFPCVPPRLEICQKIYTTEDFRVKNLHRKRAIFDIC